MQQVSAPSLNQRTPHDGRDRGNKEKLAAIFYSFPLYNYTQCNKENSRNILTPRRRDSCCSSTKKTHYYGVSSCHIVSSWHESCYGDWGPLVASEFQATKVIFIFDLLFTVTAAIFVTIIGMTITIIITTTIVSEAARSWRDKLPLGWLNSLIAQLKHMHGDQPESRWW